MDEQVLFSAKTTTLGSLRSGTSARILVFEDGMEVVTVRGLLRKEDVQRLRYDQAQHVAVAIGVVFADLSLETQGGATLMVPKMSKSDARRVRGLIHERM